MKENPMISPDKPSPESGHDPPPPNLPASVMATSQADHSQDKSSSELSYHNSETCDRQPEEVSPSPSVGDHLQGEQADGDEGGDQVNQRTLGEVIEDLNKLSRQKSGGFFNPTFHRDGPHCILCSSGSICQGVYCMGPPKTTSVSHKWLPIAPEKSFCPGLTGETSTSLIELRLDGTNKKSSVESVLPYGGLFGWEKPTHTCKKTSNSSGKFSIAQSASNSNTLASRPSISPCKQFTSARKHSPKANTNQKACIPSRPSNHCSRDVYDIHVLHKLLLKSGVKTKARGSKTSAIKKFSVPSLASSLPVKSQDISSASTSSDLFFFSTKSEDSRQDNPDLEFSSSVEQEQLRSSPSQATKSLSPEMPARTRSRHTPRKDTPKKKKDQRHQCRNQGCRVWFTSEQSRSKHEYQTCSMLPDRNSDVMRSHS